MKKIFTDIGRLSEEGKVAVEQFNKELYALLGSGKNETEVQIIGSILSNMVGDAVLNCNVKK